MQVSGKGNRGRGRRQASTASRPAAPRGLAGGRFQPLAAADLSRIDAAARSILTDIGFGDAPQAVVELVTGAGGSLDAEGRLRFPASLIDEAIDGFAREVYALGQAREIAFDFEDPVE